MEIGDLFADVRGYTHLSERTDPHELSLLLRRFYPQAEQAFFPEELIGDAVMALYIPLLGRLADPAATMVDQARKLLTGLGYGSEQGPVLDVGIGIDYGEAFVGNIGERWLFDFTAVGDRPRGWSPRPAGGRGGSSSPTESRRGSPGSAPTSSRSPRRARRAS